MGHFEPHTRQSGLHLLRLEQSQLVAFNKVLCPFRRPDQIVEVEERKTSFHKTGVDTGNLQIGLIDETGVDGARMPGIRREPGLDDEDATETRCRAIHVTARLRLSRVLT